MTHARGGERLNRLFQHERRICVIAAIALALPFFLRFPLTHAQNKKIGSVERKDRVVVVISLDGFPAYALKDPRLPIPTLRKLASEGAVAESMQPINPTVTWPNHTAIVTGVDASRHRVVFNGLLERPEKDGVPKIEPWRDKDLMVHSPTIYDVAHEAGLTTAQVDWVAIYNAKTIDWKFPELPEPDGEIEKKLIADGTVTVDDPSHPAMKGVTSPFPVEHEEWYTWDKSPRPNLHVLASVSESSYKPDTTIKMGDHPVIWTNEHYKARNIYIFMGHHPDLFENPAYTTIFRNAIFWAAHQEPNHQDCAAQFSVQ